MQEKFKNTVDTAVKKMLDRILTIKEAEATMEKMIDYLVQEKSVNIRGIELLPAIDGCRVKIKQRI